uniref:Uncharacterized protein n=1 Tax=Rhizophora mucronata TaxID=61149 RepID=A0A2P2M1L6_RHIMU
MRSKVRFTMHHNIGNGYSTCLLILFLKTILAELVMIEQ